MSKITSQIVIGLGAALVVALASNATTPAQARGGGPNLINSPGYQRALEESRKRYGAQTQPYTQPPSVYPGRKWRHRGTRVR
jgi:hypothetical protein